MELEFFRIALCGRNDLVLLMAPYVSMVVVFDTED